MGAATSIRPGELMAVGITVRFRPGWPLSLLVVGALALLVSLGTWQVQRLQWKLDLIERTRAGLAAEPVELPASASAIAKLDQRPVTAEGMLRLDLAIARGSEQRGGIPGARLVVPLERDTGAPIMVDMGWAPEPVADFLGGQPSPTAAGFSGTIRLDHLATKPLFRPANDREARRWFWYDTEALRQWTGLGDLVPATLVRRPLGVERTPPIADPPALRLKNDHLGYALTWYGLAVGLLVIYLLLGRARAKEATP